jgi:hypothetical protein
MAKVENLDLVIADYKKEYRRVMGVACPEVSIKRAWISVGEVSFRPDEFVKAVERLRTRPDFSKHSEDISNIEDYVEIQKAKNGITSTLNKLLSLNNVNSDEFGALKLNLEKSLEEIVKVEKKYCLFE